MSDCIPFTGCIDRTTGYGRVKIAGRLLGAHRVAWELANGMPVPYGLMVRHTCDNPPCINPEHLLLGTAADNMRDMSERGRSGHRRKTHCPQGHPYDEGNTRWYRGMRYCRTCGVHHNRKRSQRTAS